MSTIGHVFVGAAASRYAVPSHSGVRGVIGWILLTGAAVVPDIDLFLLPALGVPDSVTLGHRGATHSLVVALVVALVVSLILGALHLPLRRIVPAAILAVGSHALLDSLTPGPGVVWLWPFSDARMPTLPILPIAPIDDLFTRHGLMLLLAEAIVFSPFLAYAILGRARPSSDVSPEHAV
jgi:inner membrane protein